jgi:hypothetical protein
MTVTCGRSADLQVCRVGAAWLFGFLFPQVSDDLLFAALPLVGGVVECVSRTTPGRMPIGVRLRLGANIELHAGILARQIAQRAPATISVCNG